MCSTQKKNVSNGNRTESGNFIKNWKCKYCATRMMIDASGTKTIFFFWDILVEIFFCLQTCTCRVNKKRNVVNKSDERWTWYIILWYAFWYCHATSTSDYFTAHLIRHVALSRATITISRIYFISFPIWWWISSISVVLRAFCERTLEFLHHFHSYYVLYKAKKKSCKNKERRTARESFEWIRWCAFSNHIKIKWT